MAPKVLFFLPKQTRMSPSHSLKLTAGGGFLGSIRTTLLSTLGGGLKLFLPTCVAKALIRGMLRSHCASTSCMSQHRIHAENACGLTLSR